MLVFGQKIYLILYPFLGKIDNPYCHTPEKRWAKFPKRRKEQGLRGHKKKEHIGPFFIFQNLILKNCQNKRKLYVSKSLKKKNIKNQNSDLKIFKGRIHSFPALRLFQSLKQSFSTDAYQAVIRPQNVSLQAATSASYQEVITLLSRINQECQVAIINSASRNHIDVKFS